MEGNPKTLMCVDIDRKLDRDHPEQNFGIICQLQEWYEGFLKDCPSGELSKEKFIAMYSKIFPRFKKNTIDLLY